MSGTGPRGFYFGLSVLMIGILALGFGPGAYAVFVQGAEAPPWFLHIHALVFILSRSRS